MSARKTCGRCGVYRDLHPTKRCEKPRLSFWWDRHSAWRHIAAWTWIHVVPSRARFTYCDHLAGKGRDWCELVNSWWHPDVWHEWRNDYEDLCDFPLPWDAGAPRPDGCYCTPPSAGGAA